MNCWIICWKRMTEGSRRESVGKKRVKDKKEESAAMIMAAFSSFFLFLLQSLIIQVMARHRYGPPFPDPTDTDSLDLNQKVPFF